MRILLTGANGQVGQAILQKVSATDIIKITACDHNCVDITSYNSVSQAIERYSPEVIINCAAYTAVDKAELASEKQKVWLVNVEGPKILAKICTQKNIFLMHLSTDYVFDGEKKEAYLESDQTHPINFYGESKLAGEKVIKQFCPQSMILRTSWVYSEYGNNALKNIIQLMQLHEKLYMVNDQMTCPTSANEIAEVLLQIIIQHKLINGCYHYCHWSSINRFELTRHIFQTANKYKTLKVSQDKIFPVSSDYYSNSAKRPKISVLNCELFQKTFGLGLKSWEQSLASAIEKICSH